MILTPTIGMTQTPTIGMTLRQLRDAIDELAKQGGDKVLDYKVLAWTPGQRWELNRPFVLARSVGAPVVLLEGNAAE